MNAAPYLSILCVSRVEPYSLPFLQHFAELADACDAQFVIAADGLDALERAWETFEEREVVVTAVESRGYIESVLDYAIAATRGRWVLRLDDDERVNAELGAWLQERAFARAPHWSFRRANLWPDCEHALDTALLWPDAQTRLSHRELAGGRTKIHQASPHGMGEWAPKPCALEHWKFIVKSLEERRAIAKRYERQQPGTGSGVFAPFYWPEEFYSAHDLETSTVELRKLVA